MKAITGDLYFGTAGETLSAHSTEVFTQACELVWLPLHGCVLRMHPSGPTKPLGVA